VAKVTCYLVLEPVWGRGKRRDGEPVLTGAKVVRSTQTRPSGTTEGVIAKMTIDVPDAAFYPLQPTKAVLVREDQITTQVRARAEDVGD
jgi:hypothetical protein